MAQHDYLTDKTVERLIKQGSVDRTPMPKMPPLAEDLKEKEG